MTAQPTLFDAVHGATQEASLAGPPPAPPTLPAFPYAGEPPSAPTDTSRGAAAAIKPKVGNLQRRVLLALLRQPGLSDDGLETVLGCKETRSSRPRRRELERMGYVRDSGARCIGIGGVNVIEWELTEAGVSLAESLKQDAD